MPIEISYLMGALTLVFIVILGFRFNKKNRYAAFYYLICSLLAINFIVFMTSFRTSYDYMARVVNISAPMTPEDLYIFSLERNDSISRTEMDSLISLHEDSVAKSPNPHSIDRMEFKTENGNGYFLYELLQFSGVTFYGLFILVFSLSFIHPFQAKNGVGLKVLSAIMLFFCICLSALLFIYPGLLHFCGQ